MEEREIWTDIGQNIKNIIKIGLRILFVKYLWIGVVSIIFFLLMIPAIKCNKKITYKTKKALILAEKRNSKCKSCALTGRTFSEEHKKKLSIIASTKIKEKNPFYGKNILMKQN